MTNLKKESSKLKVTYTTLGRKIKQNRWKKFRKVLLICSGKALSQTRKCQIITGEGKKQVCKYCSNYTGHMTWNGTSSEILVILFWLIESESLK